MLLLLAAYTNANILSSSIDCDKTQYMPLQLYEYYYAWISFTLYLDIRQTP